MRYYHFYNKYFYLIIFIISLIFFANKSVFADIEDSFKKITSKLRCMTCQNQSIYSSDAEFSLDIKKIVREKLENGNTENQIIEFLTYRYGEYILFEPKLNKRNGFLWIFPFLILAISLVFLIFRIKNNR